MQIQKIYDNLSKKHINFVQKLSSKNFSYLGEGSTRIAYSRNNIVIKIPLNEVGLVDNLIEACAYRVYRNKPFSNGIIPAPNKYLKNGCLMMVKVDKPGMWNRNNCVPDWVYHVDSVQAGIYKNRIVAYDYSLDIPERIQWEKLINYTVDPDFNWRNCYSKRNNVGLSIWDRMYIPQILTNLKARTFFKKTLNQYAREV
jgi:hypothetical protein